MTPPSKQLQNWLLLHPKLDGFISLKEENIRWFTGFQGSFGLSLQTQKQSFLITDNRYAERAEALANASNNTFVCFDESFKDTFGHQLKGVFAIEDSTTLAQLRWLKKNFPHIKIRSQNKVVEKLRRRKTEDEIQKIRHAQSHVDALLLPFLSATLRTGISEKEVAFSLETAIRDQGRFDIAFDAIVAFGENSSIPHHAPSTRKLKKGDTLLIDCGAQYEGYCSDVTRNFGFGPISKEYEQKYEVLRKAQTKILTEYRIKKNTKSIDQQSRKYLSPFEKNFTHSLGHGVGLEVHELPNLSSRSNFVLQENDVVTCEPGLYYPGKFGIRIEDLVVIRKTEAELLSKLPKEVIVF